METKENTAQDAVALAKARSTELAQRRQELTARRGALAREVLLNGDEAKRNELQRVIVELNALGAEAEVLQQVSREAQAEWEIEARREAKAGLYAGLDEAEAMLAEIEEVTALAAQVMQRWLEAVDGAKDLAHAVQARLYAVSENRSGRNAEAMKPDDVAGMCMPSGDQDRARALDYARRRIAALRSDLDRGLKGPKAA